MFDLKRPCVDCPFRKGQGESFALSMTRIMGIVRAPAFQCHKTVDYSEDEPQPGIRPQQCAGLMAVLYREKKDNSIMQVAERMGEFDPSLLDPDGEAYGSLLEALEAHDTEGRRAGTRSR